MIYASRINNCGLC